MTDSERLQALSDAFLKRVTSLTAQFTVDIVNRDMRIKELEQENAILKKRLEPKVVPIAGEAT